MRAAAPPEELFFPDATDQPQDQDQILAEGITETLQAPARPNVSVYNYTPTQDDTVKKPGAFSNLSIFTGEDERFAYVSKISLGLIETRRLAFNRNDDLADVS
jgi:protein AFG1